MCAIGGLPMRRGSDSRPQLRASRPHSLLDARTPRVTKASLLCGSALGLTLLIFSGLAPTPAAAQQALNIVNSNADEIHTNDLNCTFNLGDCIFISTINGHLINLTNNGILVTDGLGNNGIQLDTEGSNNVGGAGGAGGSVTGGSGSSGLSGVSGPNGTPGDPGEPGGSGLGGNGGDGESAVGGAAGNITTINNNAITTFGDAGHGIFETSHGGSGTGGAGGAGGSGTGGVGGDGGAGGAADPVADSNVTGGIGGGGGGGGAGGAGAGGSGGAGGTGTGGASGDITITNNAPITTNGNFADGIIVDTHGGSGLGGVGGAGGNGTGGSGGGGGAGGAAGDTTASIGPAGAGRGNAKGGPGRGGGAGGAGRCWGRRNWRQQRYRHRRQ